MTTEAAGAPVYAVALRDDTDGPWRLLVEGEQAGEFEHLGDAKREADRRHVLPLSWQSVRFDSLWQARPADLELLERIYRGDDETQD